MRTLEAHYSQFVSSLMSSLINPFLKCSSYISFKVIMCISVENEVEYEQLGTALGIILDL